MNETVAWRTRSVIQDQSLPYLESWWIQSFWLPKLAVLNGEKKKRKRERRKDEKSRPLITLIWEWSEAPILLLHFFPRGAEGDELWSSSMRNATASEQPSLQPGGFCLTVTQDGPQFRTQSLGQNSRRYSLFPWERSIPFHFIVSMLSPAPSLLCFFLCVSHPLSVPPSLLA